MSSKAAMKFILISVLFVATIMESKPQLVGGISTATEQDEERIIETLKDNLHQLKEESLK